MHAVGIHKPAQSSSGHFGVLLKKKGTLFNNVLANSECPDHPVHVHTTG